MDLFDSISSSISNASSSISSSFSPSSSSSSFGYFSKPNFSFPSGSFSNWSMPNFSNLSLGIIKPNIAPIQDNLLLNQGVNFSNTLDKIDVAGDIGVGSTLSNIQNALSLDNIKDSFSMDGFKDFFENNAFMDKFNLEGISEWFNGIAGNLENIPILGDVMKFLGSMENWQIYLIIAGVIAGVGVAGYIAWKVYKKSPYGQASDITSDITKQLLAKV